MKCVMHIWFCNLPGLELALSATRSGEFYIMRFSPPPWPFRASLVKTFSSGPKRQPLWTVVRMECDVHVYHQNGATVLLAEANM
jgi:hypothetical protein